MFVRTALTGISTEPVSRNSSTSVAAATTPSTSHMRAVSASTKSTSAAGWPVAQVWVVGGALSRSCRTACVACGESALLLVRTPNQV